MRPALVAVLVVLAGSAAAEKPELQLAIDSPAPGAVIGDVGGMAFVSGKALALFGEYQTFDILFVIDTSASTAAPSGADVDGDGKIGQRGGNNILRAISKIIPLPNSDRGDSILAAEVAALDNLLGQLDPRTTRLGLIAFSGDRDALTPDAYTEVPLTTDFRKVKRGLSSILSRGPDGMTNMMSAVSLGAIELSGTQSAYSEKRVGSKRIMLFLTDGHPTLPLENSRLQNARMAVQMAHKAAKLDIRIDTYAIGPGALAEPIVVVEMARVTNGVFTPILDPTDLRAVFEDVTFAEIEELTVRNRTTRAPASYTIQNADGTFSALLPMQEGWNTVEVTARATDGTVGRRQVKVRFLPGGEVQGLTPRQVGERNRLLENRLLDLQRRRVEIETERDESIRKSLADRIDEQRRAAEEKANAMRKDLELEVLDEDGTPGRR